MLDFLDILYGSQCFRSIMDQVRQMNYFSQSNEFSSVAFLDKAFRLETLIFADVKDTLENNLQTLQNFQFISQLLQSLANSEDYLIEATLYLEKVLKILNMKVKVLEYD